MTKPGLCRGPLPARAAAVACELPDGTLDAAEVSIRRGLADAGESVGGYGWATPDGIAELVLAPVILDPDWPPPSSPLPVGTGAVHADLTDEDHEAFARLRTSRVERQERIDPEAVAAEAQQWRLPVTPYRAPAANWPTGDEHRSPQDNGPDSGVKPAHPGDNLLVLDLTALWAGPLATMLLARLGATVVKIDSSARQDGLRGHPKVYDHLNATKTIEDMDLRRDPDRARFEELLARADLVIDSFSRRVMPNLGYPPHALLARYPQLRSLSIVAFPASMPEAEWVSYGPGVHAVSGLGHRGGKPPTPAPLAYPDALAGFEAFAAACRLLCGRSSARRVEVSLAGSLGPLVEARIAAAVRTGNGGGAQ